MPVLLITGYRTTGRRATSTSVCDQARCDARAPRALATSVSSGAQKERRAGSLLSFGVRDDCRALLLPAPFTVLVRAWALGAQRRNGGTGPSGLSTPARNFKVARWNVVSRSRTHRRAGSLHVADYPAVVSEDARELEISYSPGLEAWLDEQRVSLAFAVPPAKLFLIGLRDDGRLSAFERTFNKCMGLACAGSESIYLGTRYQI